MFCFGIGEGKIVALLGLGGGREDGFGQLGGLEEVLWKGSTPSGAFLFVFFPGAAGEVAADDTFDGERFGGTAAGEAAGESFRIGDTSGDIESEDMVRLGGG